MSGANMILMQGSLGVRPCSQCGGWKVGAEKEKENVSRGKGFTAPKIQSDHGARKGLDKLTWHISMPGRVHGVGW